MRRMAALFIIWGVSLIILSSSLMADASFVPRTLADNDKYVTGRVIVQFKEYALPQYFPEKQSPSFISLGNSSLDALNQKYRVRRAMQIFPGAEQKAFKETDEMAGFYVLEFDPSIDVMQAVLEYGKNDYVVYAGPDYLIPMSSTPNDYYLNLQYWLNNSLDHDIDAPEVWTYESGADTILVGVIDSGVLWKHPDLLGNIWQNLGEDVDGDGHTIENGVFDPGDVNNVNNDGYGGSSQYRDDFIGWDWVAVGGGGYPGEDVSVADNDPADFSGHGTNISGIIAAVTNNGKGVAGIAGGFRPRFPGVRIMCLRAGYLASDTIGYNILSYSATAINYAVHFGVDVINLSFGPNAQAHCTPGWDLDPTMRAAILTALNNGVVVTHAAGNDNDTCASYMDMESYCPGVLSVAATDSFDFRAWFSNFGSWIDLSAAGVLMETTESDYTTAPYYPSYAAWDGTSYSAPVAAGVAALVKSHNPTLGKDSINKLLKNYADNINAENPGYIGRLGTGRVNAYNSILAMPTAYFTTSSNPVGWPALTVSFADASPTAGIISWDWTFGDGGIDSGPNPSHQYTTAGLYDVSLTISAPTGHHKFTYPKAVFALGDTMWVSKLDNVEVDQTVRIYFYLKNTENVKDMKIPFDFSGECNLEWTDYSIHTSGTRCSTFETVNVIGVGENKAYIQLRADNNNDGTPLPLAPGSGPICWAEFIVHASGTSNISLADTWNTFVINGVYFDYQSRFLNGYVSTHAPGKRGDANSDGSVNVSDAVYIINYVFAGGTPPPTLCAGDANSDGTSNVSDAVYIINYVFAGGTPPAPC